MEKRKQRALADKKGIVEIDNNKSPNECVVYPQDYVDCINNEVEQLKQEIKDGKRPVFSNADDLIESLNKE